MALLFDANTEHVTYGTLGGWNPSAKVTAFGWFNIAAIGTSQVIFVKNTLGPLIELTNGDGNFRIIRDRVTDTHYQVQPTPFTANSWQFWAMTMDTGAGAGNKIDIYRGTLTASASAQGMTVIAEGADGLVDTGGSDLLVGGAAGDTDLNGSMANIVIVDGHTFTASQVVACQYKLSTAFGIAAANAGTVKLYTEFGYHGATTQVNLNGSGDNGTGTNGPTLADHVPLGPPFGFDDSTPYAVTVASNPNQTQSFFMGKLLGFWPMGFLIGAIRNLDMNRREFWNPLNWWRK